MKVKELSNNDNKSKNHKKPVFPNTIEELFAEIRIHEKVIIFTGKCIML